jgi:hypothetical protein
MIVRWKYLNLNENSLNPTERCVLTPEVAVASLP